MDYSKRGAWVEPAFFAVLLVSLRFLLIGQPPFTDDGAYISTAYFLWHHPGEVIPSLCPVSSISLYSSLFAWMFSFCADGFVAFRVIDAVIAAVSAIQFYRLLRELAGHRVVASILAFLWVVCSNHPIFINAGFKNAYAPGFACIFTALLFLVREKTPGRMGWIGSLFGLAFLFREPLVMFFAPAAIYVGWQYSIRDAVRLALGTGLTIVAGVLGLGLIRGADPVANTANMFHAWGEIGRMHTVIVQLDRIDRWQHAAAQLRDVYNVVGWALPVWLIGLAGGLWALVKNGPHRRQAALVVLTILAPLPEFFLKLGFPYHLSATFIGLSMAGAVGWNFLGETHPRQTGLVAVLGLALAFVVPATAGGTSLRTYFAGFDSAIDLSREFSAVMWRGSGAEETRRRSFYLEAAAAIQRHSRPGESVLVSGFYLGLYPLSDRLPPELEITDLTLYAFGRGLVLTAGERRRLNEHLPTLFVETNRYQDFDLTSLFDHFAERYRLVETVETGRAHYGGFSGRIYRRIDRP